ncbi:MAG: lytic transglycosylase domain-containing protein [Lachnospiraceae bacterium]|nr:lytic transglycosylase domain-containing protein [Lachnospiraceae bacterium]
MKISVINDQGTTVYTETVEKAAPSADFANTLAEEATKLADHYNGLSTANADSRTMSLEDMLNEAAETYNIDVNFLKAVAKLESDFDPDCVSSAGAVGIMQMLPSTAEGLGVEDIYDPYQNIMAGAKYLRQMLDRFDGDYELAYAGYNAGPNAVARAGGIPDNGETPKAVALVMGYYNNGVEVPDRVYTVSAGSSSEVSASSAEARAKVAAELAEKLKEFPNHTSYEFFVEELQKQGNSTTDTAYENLLSQANQIIRQMIEDGN